MDCADLLRRWASCTIAPSTPAARSVRRKWNRDSAGFGLLYLAALLRVARICPPLFARDAARATHRNRWVFCALAGMLGCLRARVPGCAVRRDRRVASRLGRVMFARSYDGSPQPETYPSEMRAHQRPHRRRHDRQARFKTLPRSSPGRSRSESTSRHRTKQDHLLIMVYWGTTTGAKDPSNKHLRRRAEYAVRGDSSPAPSGAILRRCDGRAPKAPSPSTRIPWN